jgi:hypothetical protein
MLDALLDGGPLPDGEDPARWQPVAQVLTALTSAPESSELAGEARALAEFRSRSRGAPRPSRASRRDRWWAASLRIPRPAVAAATGAVAMGGLLAVAYAGDLPAAAQRLAHDTIGAPAAARDGGPRLRPGLPGPGVAPGFHGRAGEFPIRLRAGPGGPPDGPPSLIGLSVPHWPASSAPGPAGGGPPGRPGQYSPGQYSPGQGTPGQAGTPGGSPTPGPTQQPSPWASSSPSPGAAPSPTASPSTSQQSRHQHEPLPAATQSFPP